MLLKATAFVGHRPESLPFGENELSPAWIRLKVMLLSEIMDRAEAGFDTFYCGAARGADIIYGRQVLLVKATTRPDIRLVCVVPHEEETDGWSEEWRERRQTLLEQADEVIPLSGCQRKNCYMIDHSAALIALYNGSPTGDAACAVRYAQQMNREIVVINPNTLERAVTPADIR